MFGFGMMCPKWGSQWVSHNAIIYLLLNHLLSFASNQYRLGIYKKTSKLKYFEELTVSLISLVTILNNFSSNLFNITRIRIIKKSHKI